MNSAVMDVDYTPSGVEGVRETLRTDIIAIFQSQIEALRPLTRDAAYNRVMNNPHVLDGCFKIFRARPDLFDGVIVDQHGKLAVHNHTILTCGRTLADAIALVVRAAAKRYFRAHEELIPNPCPSAAETLYTTLKDVLQFEWQTVLIPNYLKLPIPLIKQIGPRLFDFQEPTEVMGLADSVEPADSRRPPLLMDNANRVLIKGKEVIDPEILWKVCQQMNMSRLYPDQDAKGVRVAVSQIAVAQPGALSAMIPLLGRDIRRFCVFLFVVHASLGAARFKSIYGEGGQTYVVRRWMERLKEFPPPPTRLSEMISHYEMIINSGAT